MVARTNTFWLTGLDARRVEVEAHVHRGAPSFVVVGLADRAVQEARQRVRSGIASSQLEFPRRRLTVNLAPAQERKEGSGFDLSIALAVLAASGQVPAAPVERVAAAAELGLDGTLRPVRGALAMAETAAGAGLDALLMAPESAGEAAQAGAGIRVLAARTLPEAIDVLTGRSESAPLPEPRLAARAPVPDLADVRGQQRARRALEIVAAGAHNMLLAGPPGSGKTMLARRLPGILPPPSPSEAIEIGRVLSAAGLLAPGECTAERPFRAPHHSASAAALVGGRGLRPGEVTMAHRGVLFLDELPEFSRPALESLRTPLEDREVVIARSTGVVRMPADCIVVAAMNPCPCGAAGDPGRECQCPHQKLSMYRARISGPLLDRFDVRVAVPRAEAHGPAGEPSQLVAERVSAARSRLGDDRPELTPESEQLVDRAVAAGMLSGRGAARTRAVAATIAALEGAGRVSEDHVAEALSYRDAA